MTDARTSPWHDSTIAMFESWLTLDNERSMAKVSRRKYLKFEEILVREDLDQTIQT